MNTRAKKSYAKPKEPELLIGVTVVVPTLNEGSYIRACLDSILAACEGVNAEILVVDGMSNDGTRKIVAEYQAAYPVRLLDNPDVYQVHALNIGVRLSRGEIIVRCDAHSIYPPSYLKDIIRFYEKDEERLYGNVGTTYVTESAASNSLCKGISLAMCSRLGVGASHRHVANLEAPREVDTLLFGAWRREVFDRVGLFDPAFIRGQDYEHNLRLRQAGLVVALIPAAPFVYYTRPTFKKLRKMIFQYAYVKGQLVRKLKRLPNIRSVIPVLFFLAIVSAFTVNAILGLGVLGVYILSLLACAAITGCDQGLVPALGMALAMPQMHVSHALGFLRGMVSNSTHQAFINKAGHTR